MRDNGPYWIRSWVVLGKRIFAKNQAVVVLFLIAAVILPPLILSKLGPPKFKNKELGYEFIVPRQWQVKTSDDARVIALQRIKGKTVGEASIKLIVDEGNPYGATAEDYINNHLLPQAKDLYENQKQLTITSKGDPRPETHNGVEWVKVSYLINYNDLQVIYVTQTPSSVFAFIMTSQGTDQGKDEKSLRELLDSFVLQPQEKFLPL